MTESTLMTQRIAARAAIVDDGKLLVIRESTDYEGGSRHGYYDLPGGKVHVGESVHACLHREVGEEAGIEVEIVKPIHVGEWRPTVKGELLQIFGIFFLCRPRSTNVALSKDHDDYRWATAKELKALPVTDPLPEAIAILEQEGLL